MKSLIKSKGSDHILYSISIIENIQSEPNKTNTNVINVVISGNSFLDSVINLPLSYWRPAKGKFIVGSNVERSENSQL